jgi:hypothetical protein
MAEKKKLSNDEAVKIFSNLFMRYRDNKKVFKEMDKLYSYDKKSVIDIINNPYKQKQPKQETPKQETPKQETPKQETPKQETPKQETPKQETPTAVAKAEETTNEATKKRDLIKKIVEGLKKCKGSKTCIFSTLGTAVAGLYAIKKANNNQQPAQPQQTPQPKQPAIQTTDKQQEQPAQQQQPTAPAVAPAQDLTSEYSEELKQAQSQMLGLFQDLDKYRQQYEETSQRLSQANELYEKQLLQILPTIPLLLAKTPLNSMTNEDLIQHTNQLFTTMPYEDAIGRVGNLTKGYYIAKMNGVDPKSLSTTDLLEIAENPVLAKSSDENLAQFLGQIGEVLKYKIKSNLDKVGAIKDAYDLRLKELKEKGDMYKETLKTIQQEFNYRLNFEKLDATINNMNARLGLLEDANKLRYLQIIDNQGKGGEGKSNDLQEIAKKLSGEGQPQQLTQQQILQICPPDPKFPTIPNLECMKQKGLIK